MSKEREYERAARSTFDVRCRGGCVRSKWAWSPCKRHKDAMLVDFAGGG